jgi:hypothetical protein
MTRVALSYVALCVRDRSLAEDVLANDLGLARSEVRTPAGTTGTAFAVGASALIVLEAGDGFLSNPERVGVDHIAISSADPLAACRDAGLAPEGDVAGGLNETRACRTNSKHTSGLALRFATPLNIQAQEVSRYIERIDHIGIASDNNVAAEEIFVTGIGCPVESRQTDIEVRQAIESFTSDKYGVVYHSRAPEPIGGLRVSFLSVGDCELEFLQDYDPRKGTDMRHGTPGTTKQDQSAIGSFVAKHGPGLHHIALKTPDINAALSHLAERGRRLIDMTGRPGGRRSQIGFVHPAALGGVLMHFVERDDFEPAA